VGAAANERNENVRRIVSDTGPLLHLSEAQALDLLGQAGEIHVPQAVDVAPGCTASVLTSTGSGSRRWRIMNCLSLPPMWSRKSWNTFRF